MLYGVFQQTEGTYRGDIFLQKCVKYRDGRDLKPELPPNLSDRDRVPKVSRL